MAHAPRPIHDLAVAPPPHPRPAISRCEVLAVSALHAHLEGADASVVAEAASIPSADAERALESLARDGFVTSSLATVPWRHETRRALIWQLTERARQLSPYVPRLRQSRRAPCPKRLPEHLWHWFRSGPDPADIRLPQDALLVANRLLNGHLLDPDAKRWALRHLPVEALSAQTAIPGCPPDVQARIDELVNGPDA